MTDQADIIIVGGGLAGLVAACEAAERGKSVIVVDQEGVVVHAEQVPEIAQEPNYTEAIKTLA